MVKPLDKGGPMPGNKHILIVDDDSTIRRTFSRILQSKNYDTMEAASGEEALALINSQPVDLVLLDLKMPGLNGVDTLREIRKIDEKLPVYVVTAFRNEFFEDLQKLSNEGISFELMQKPIESQQLVEVVESVLS
jgi:DNA-binding NtrC family response regulator